MNINIKIVYVRGGKCENIKENIKNNKKTDGKIIKENDEQLIKEEANKYNGEKIVP